MKFSLFYPIFQKNCPYEMPYFQVKRHFKPCKPFTPNVVIPAGNMNIFYSYNLQYFQKKITL